MHFLDSKRFKYKLSLVNFRVRYIIKICRQIILFSISVLLLYISILVFVFKHNLFEKQFDQIKSSLLLFNNYINSDICKNIYIDGVVHAKYNKILQKVNRYCRNGNKDLIELKEQILQDYWIKNIYINKIFPDALKIKIIEYNPFAIWINSEGYYTILDEYGDKIEVNKDEKIFDNLLVVVGDNVTNNIYDLFNYLSIHSTISNRIDKAIRVGNRRWDLILKGGVTIKLPEESGQDFKVWQEVEKLLKLDKVNTNLEIIDLRIENKIFLKYNEKYIMEMKKLLDNAK